MYLDFNTHCGIKNYLLIRFFVYILSAYKVLYIYATLDCTTYFLLLLQFAPTILVILLIKCLS